MSNLNNSENNNQNLNAKAVPFFARYLEGQSVEDLSEDEMEAIGGSCGAVTYKYPSDNEDGGMVTEKYPSDTDEVVMTLKYPSDNEDGGGGGPVTLKYPSDTDE